MMMFFSLNMVDSKFVFSICFFFGFFLVFFGFMPKIRGWWVVVAYKILVSATHSPFGPIRNYWDLSGVVAHKILETANSDFRIRLVNINFIGRRGFFKYYPENISNPGDGPLGAALGSLVSVSSEGGEMSRYLTSDCTRQSKQKQIRPRDAGS